MAPVGFGWSRPINYVDFPESEEDFYQIKEVPHCTVAQKFFYSSVTGQYESCMLYLPPDYMKETERDLPVLYLQHGHGENERCWIYQGKINFIMDNLLAENKAKPCIIVMNNGMVQIRREGKRRIYSNTAVRADAGCVAVMRGPLVYCFEGTDNAGELQALRIPREGAIEDVVCREGVLKDMILLKVQGVRMESGASLYTEMPPRATIETLTAIPYYAWGNRDIRKLIFCGLGMLLT